MQIRTFLGILAALVLVAFLAGLGYQNQLLLDQRFQLTPTRTVPLWTILVSTFVTGVLTFIVAFLLRGSADLVERWRMLQGRRAGRTLDDIFNRGLEATLEGREQRAIELFESILSRNPEHYHALLKAGAILRALKKPSEAVDLHKRAHRLRDQALEPLYELVKDYEALDQVAKTKVVLNRLIELRPKRALSAYRKLRTCAIKEGDWARALELQDLIEKQIERTPQKVEAERRHELGIRYELACTTAREGLPREAISTLHRILKSAPHFVPAHLKLGAILENQGQSEEAIAAWVGGFDLTGSPAFLSRLEEHFLHHNDPEGAIRALQQAVSRATRDFMARFFLAKLYLRLEMIDEAHRELAMLAEHTSTSPTLQAYLGFAHERRQDYKASAACYRKVIEGLDYFNFQYRCKVCDERSAEWVDRCQTCGEWNQIAPDFGEDPSLEEMKLSTGPVYSRTT